MSSGNLVPPNNPEAFMWSADQNPAEYIFATYWVTARCSGEEAALGMAMEQSAATLYIKGYVSSDMLESFTIRVRRADPIDADIIRATVPEYFLNTEVYGGTAQDAGSYEIELAVPASLLGHKPAQLLNVLVGELPRLGFLSSFKLADVRLPNGFGPGPSFGRPGILNLLDKTQGPLLCRSMRPGVGLETEVMARLNRDVLAAGFHLVKDDELIFFPDISSYRNHLQSMIQARNEAMQLSGERKLYLANLICEPDELMPRWELACELGVDGVLVAPFIQGLGVLPVLAKQQQLPLLAHNSFIDMFSRHGAWGIDDAVVCHLMRHLGADWFVTPGPFATPGMNVDASQCLMKAAVGDPGKLRPMMPNIQGGKHPEGLPCYREAVGDTDYMLIVAHWVDSHPRGFQAAARIFREALENQ